jgi:3-oxoacyl-[acyl-carrier-protein] synthase II
MTVLREVVLTGLGVVSPIGIGRASYWESLLAGRSGVQSLAAFDEAPFPARCGGQITDFDAKFHVTPRKSLKVMSLETQWAFAAARLAGEEAGIRVGAVDPDRFGVVFGADMIYCDPTELIAAFKAAIVDGTFDFSRWGPHAMGEMHPLWLLKYLPNMPACHIGIAHDARGPNNSITLGEVSSLVAMSEGQRLIERGAADVIITGGTGYRLNPMAWCFRTDDYLSCRFEDPAAACRPFDADRDGTVLGDGAAAFVLESRGHAEARRAPVLARLLSYASAYEPRPGARNGRRETLGDTASSGAAIRRVIKLSLERAGLTARDIGHVNAHGLGTREHDRREAAAIRDLLGDVPVTALKSFFGNSGAGSGAIEAVASVLALQHGQIPFTLNYHRPDSACPVNVVSKAPAPLEKPTALLLNQSTIGQAVAIVLAGPNF